MPGDETIDTARKKTWVKHSERVVVTVFLLAHLLRKQSIVSHDVNNASGLIWCESSMWLPSLVCDLMSIHTKYKDTPLMVRSAVAADFVFKCNGGK